MTSSASALLSGWQRPLGDCETAISPSPSTATYVDVSWLVRAEQLGRHTFDHAHLTSIFNSIETLMGSGSFRLLGSLLASLDMERVSPQVMIAALRASAPGKDAIPKWTNVVSAVKAELSRRQLNAERLLRGL